MNEYQQAYATAKAQYDTASAARKAHLENHQEYQANLHAFQGDQPETEESTLALEYTFQVEIDADRQFGLKNLTPVLRKSEDILLDKFHVYITSVPKCPAEILDWFKKWKAGKIVLVKHKQMLVNIAMQNRLW